MMLKKLDKHMGGKCLDLPYAILKNSRLAIYLNVKAFRKKQKVFPRPWGGQRFLNEDIK